MHIACKPDNPLQSHSCSEFHNISSVHPSLLFQSPPPQKKKRALHSQLQGFWSPSQLSGRRKKKEKTTLCSFIKNTEPKCMSPEHSMITQNSNVSLNKWIIQIQRCLELRDYLQILLVSTEMRSCSRSCPPGPGQITIWGWQSQLTKFDWLQCVMTYDYWLLNQTIVKKNNNNILLHFFPQ